MSVRTVLAFALGVLLLPFPVPAQQAAKPARVGILLLTTAAAPTSLQHFRAGVDVIYTASPPAAGSAKQATSTVPIVLAGIADPHHGRTRGGSSLGDSASVAF